MLLDSLPDARGDDVRSVAFFAPQAAPQPVHPVLSKAEYLALRARISFERKLLPSAGMLFLDVLLLLAVSALLRAEHWAAFALSQVLLAVVFFNAFAILHECAHGTLSASPVVNSLVGHITSALCFTPFYPFRYIHQKHHAFTGNVERDPSLKSLRIWRTQGVPRLVRACWFFWIPLGALLQHLVYASFPLELRRAGALTKHKALRCLVSTLWLPVSWFLAFSFAPDLVSWSNMLPALVLFLFAEELVNIPHHVGTPTFSGRLAVWEQYLASRSCYYPAGVSELLVLNFNFHIEHHMFPNLPWFRLRSARRAVKALLGERYVEAVGIEWNLRHRSRDLQRIVREAPSA